MEKLGIQKAGLWAALCILIPVAIIVICWAWFSLPAGWWPVVPFVMFGGFIMIRERHENKQVRLQRKQLDEVERLERLFHES